MQSLTISSVDRQARLIKSNLRNGGIKAAPGAGGGGLQAYNAKTRSWYPSTFQGEVEGGKFQLLTDPNETHLQGEMLYMDPAEVRPAHPQEANGYGLLLPQKVQY